MSVLSDYEQRVSTVTKRVHKTSVSTAKEFLSKTGKLPEPTAAPCSLRGSIGARLISKDELFDFGYETASNMTDDVETQPVCISFMSEVWIKKLKKGEQQKGSLQDEKGNPKKGVEEMFMVSTLSVDRELIITLFDIKRDNGTITLENEHTNTSHTPSVLDRFYAGAARCIKDKMVKEHL